VPGRGREVGGEPLPHHGHRLADAFGVRPGAEAFTHVVDHRIPVAGGHQGVHTAVAHHGHGAVAHGDVDQHGVAPAGVLHAQFLEDEHGMVEHILLDVVLQVHPDLRIAGG